ncbi:hypothetical protein ACEPAF_8350 [Sanghuangporus sanghuang]
MAKQTLIFFHFAKRQKPPDSPDSGALDGAPVVRNRTRQELDGSIPATLSEPVSTAEMIAQSLTTISDTRNATIQP